MQASPTNYLRMGKVPPSSLILKSVETAELTVYLIQMANCNPLRQWEQPSQLMDHQVATAQVIQDLADLTQALRRRLYALVETLLTPKTKPSAIHARSTRSRRRTERYVMQIFVDLNRNCCRLEIARLALYSPENRAMVKRVLLINVK